MKKRSVCFLVLLLAFVVACTGALIAAPKKGGVLRVAYSDDPSSLDAHKSPEVGFVHSLFVEPLVYFGEDLKYHGLLAESWQIKNGGLEVTFKMKQGITFHDGTPLDAEAVAYNFRRILNPATAAPGAGQISSMKSVRVDSKYAVTFIFDKPMSSLLYNLAQLFFAIQSPTAIEKWGADYGQKAVVGTGPFKFQSLEPGRKLTLVRNEAYKWAPSHYKNKGAAYLEKVVFYNMPDAMTGLLSLKQGEIDINGIPTQYVSMIEKDKNISLKIVPVGRVNYLGFNCSKYPWNDPKVRRAIGHAIDRDEIVKVVMSGQATANPTPIAPTIMGHDKSLYKLVPAKNIEAGKKLLKEAGWTQKSDGWYDKNGKKIVLEIMTYTSEPYPRMAQVLREQIIRLGIDVKIATLESATLLSKTPAGEHDAILIAYGWSDPDILTYFFHSKNLDRTNRVHYVNKQVDALLDKAQTIMDQKERILTYKKIQEILLNESPWICLFTPTQISGYRNSVKDFKVGPLGDYWIHDVYIEE